MSMKTRSQTNSDNEDTEESPLLSPKPIVPEPIAAQIIASIEVNENSPAFLAALDRALVRLMGSRDDAAKVPAVYATGEIAVRTDQPYSDQSSSRNPLDRISATKISRSNRFIGDLISLGSTENGEKNLANEGYRGNPCKLISTRRQNDDDSSSDERRKKLLKLRKIELHARRQLKKKSDKSSRESSRKSSYTTSNNDNVDSPRNEADLVSGSISNNDNDGKVDSNPNNKNTSSSRKISHKKGDPSDSSDDPSSEESTKSKGNARHKKKIRR